MFSKTVKLSDRNNRCVCSNNAIGTFFVSLETGRRFWAFVREEDGKPDHYPAQCTTNSHTNLDVCLDHQKDDSSPEDNFQGVEDCIRFEASPFSERRDVLGQDLVEYDDQRFGTLFDRSCFSCVACSR